MTLFSFDKNEEISTHAAGDDAFVTCLDGVGSITIDGQPHILHEGEPCEIEIVSEFEANVRGKDAAACPQLIAEFRFYAPHITTFYDAEGRMLEERPRVQLLTIPMEAVQPSQFLVDRDKLAAVGTFIHEPQDVILQVLPHNGRYIVLDGHTRLYYAVQKGWTTVRGIVETSDDYIFGLVNEAHTRGIFTPSDMTILPHVDYETQWYGSATRSSRIKRRNKFELLRR